MTATANFAPSAPVPTGPSLDAILQSDPSATKGVAEFLESLPDDDEYPQGCLSERDIALSGRFGEHNVRKLRAFAGRSYVAKIEMLERRIQSLEGMAARCQERVDAAEGAEKLKLQAVAEIGQIALNECKAELARFKDLYADGDDYRWLVAGRC